MAKTKNIAAEDILGYTGGTLPIYREGQPDVIAACSCAVGTYMMQYLKLKRYDSYPGTSTDDNKSTLVFSHHHRLLQLIEERRSLENAS